MEYKWNFFSKKFDEREGTRMNYKIKQKDAYWEMETEKAISIEDCCYDITTDTFVIAVKHN